MNTATLTGGNGCECGTKIKMTQSPCIQDNSSMSFMLLSAF